MSILGPDPGRPRRRRGAGAVLELGGSVSAEHGIGIAKVGWLVRDRGPEAVGAMRALKAALDPAGILNPGVLFERWKGIRGRRTSGSGSRVPATLLGPARSSPSEPVTVNEASICTSTAVPSSRRTSTPYTAPSSPLSTSVTVPPPVDAERSLGGAVVVGSRGGIRAAAVVRGIRLGAENAEALIEGDLDLAGGALDLDAVGAAFVAGLHRRDGAAAGRVDTGRRRLVTLRSAGTWSAASSSSPSVAITTPTLPASNPRLSAPRNAIVVASAFPPGALRIWSGRTVPGRT